METGHLRFGQVGCFLLPDSQSTTKVTRDEIQFVITMIILLPLLLILIIVSSPSAPNLKCKALSGYTDITDNHTTVHNKLHSSQQS